MPRALVIYWNLHRIPILLLLLSLGLYAAFAYDLVRSDSIKLLTLYGALFFLCFKLIQFEKWNFRFLLVAGILFRLVFLWAEPQLSQDFYRFIWDGTLLSHGYNPYEQTPDAWMMQDGLRQWFPLAETLHENMGSLSARNFSNYPPANQYFFALCVKLGGGGLTGSMLAMRILLILADIGTFYFGRRLLLLLNKAPYAIFWFFLNPLVIVELTGNLHFEGVMVFFFALSLYLLMKFGWIWGALPYAVSIGVKLVPLMLLPLMLPLLGIRKALGFYLLTGLGLALLIYPLYFPDLGAHYLQTLQLWFSNFEFNAGIYRVAEALAEWQGVKPWKFIAQYGKVVPYLTAATALLLCLHPRMRRSKSWFTGALAVLTVYYLTAAVVHPWYLVFPLFVSLYTRFRFFIVWSAVVMLSYTAYSGQQVEEQALWIGIEYLAVFVMMGYEIFRNRKEIMTIVKKDKASGAD